MTKFYELKPLVGKSVEIFDKFGECRAADGSKIEWWKAPIIIVDSLDERRVILRDISNNTLYKYRFSKILDVFTNNLTIDI